MAVWTTCDRCKGSGIEPGSSNGRDGREACQACKGKGGDHV